MPQYTLKQLAHFRVVAESGSFRAAADQLNITQPPLSRQIRQLEEALGAPLFDRSERRIALTPAGRYLYRYSLSLLRSAESLQDDFRAFARGESGELRIGLTDDFVSSPIYAAALSFVTQRPDVRLQTTMSISTILLERLLARQLDLVFTNLPLAYDEAQVTTHRTPRTRFVVIVPADHPWAKRKQLKVGELHQQPLILMPPDATAPFAVQYRKLFAAEGITTLPCPTSDNPELQMQMAQRGIGLGLTTEHSIAGHYPDLVQIPLSHPLAYLDHGMLYLTDEQSPVLRQLVDHLDV